MELRIFKAIQHSGCKRVAEDSDELQPVLEAVVSCIIARKSGSGYFQAGQTEFTHWSVDALVGARQLYEFVSTLANALWQSPTLQILRKRAALALIVVPQSEQTEKCRADVGVVGPNGISDSPVLKG